MKFVLALIVLGFGSSAFACPDFSGEFVSEEFGTYYSISQDACDVIHYHYDEGVVDRPLDGKEYLVNQYDIVVKEGEVLATVKIYEGVEFKGNKLITKARSETIYTRGDVDRDEGVSESYLNKTNDLVTVSRGKDGKQTTVDKRVK